MSCSPMFDQVRRWFRLAHLANQPGSPPVDELVEMDRKLRLSRREFLIKATAGASLLASGGLLAACSNDTPPVVPQSGVQPSIAIVGAGIAGMNAAWRLSKFGYRADIYEASNRVGGRMFTVSDVFGPGITTELGGEFIDSDHTEMLNLVGEFNLPLIDVLIPSELALVDTWFFDGQQFSESQVVAAFQPLAARIQADQDSLPDTIDFQTQNAAAVTLDNLTLRDYLTQIGATGVIREILDVAYVTEDGLDSDQMSSLGLITEISTDTSSGQLVIFGDSNQQFKIEGGNQRLPQAIATVLANTSPVHLEHRLVALREVASGFVLSFDTPGGLVEVAADFVILTVPFSVLRQIPLHVDLPAIKTNCIQNLPYGTNAKLIMGFQSRYWRNQGRVGLFFTDLPFQSGWDSSQLQAGTAASLTCFLGGTPGVLVEQDTPEDQANAFLPGVEQMFPGANAQFTETVRRFTWPSFPFALGSYSCYGPGQWTTILGSAILPVGRLYFAGEHCSDTFFGFMEGGAETGRMAAESLLSSLGVRVGLSRGWGGRLARSRQRWPQSVRLELQALLRA